MGSTGAVRSRAWICGFSSTQKTAAFAGGARYRPATSRILSISRGSGETLNVSVRQGWSPNARQIRSTLDGEMPARRTETFKVSPDPLLIDKIRDVAGLYLAPP